jgi:hypothetical protein
MGCLTVNYESVIELYIRRRIQRNFELHSEFQERFLKLFFEQSCCDNIAGKAQPTEYRNKKNCFDMLGHDEGGDEIASLLAEVEVIRESLTDKIETVIARGIVAGSVANCHSCQLVTIPIIRNTEYNMCGFV